MPNLVTARDAWKDIIKLSGLNKAALARMLIGGAAGFWLHIIIFGFSDFRPALYGLFYATELIICVLLIVTLVRLLKRWRRWSMKYNEAKAKFKHAMAEGDYELAQRHLMEMDAALKE